MTTERIAIVLIVKNEARIIYEWLAHHAAIGVDHFYIYENGSTDATRDEIRAFPEQRRITLIDWPMEYGQLPAYADALKRFGRRWDWMAFIDADEFLMPMPGETLKGVLADLADADGLAIPWHIFGSNGHRERPPGLVLENFTRRGLDRFTANRHTKCIMRPSRTAGVTGSSHMFTPKNDRVVLEDGRRVDPTSAEIGEDFPPKRLRLHHYVIQSWEDYQVKSARGVAIATEPRDAGFFERHDRNEVEDTYALNFVPAIRAYQARRRKPRSALLRIFGG